MPDKSFVRHRNHVAGKEVRPFVIASLPTFRRRGRLSRISIQPICNYVMVILLGPEHPRKALAGDPLGVCRELVWQHDIVELISLFFALGEQSIEIREGVLQQRSEEHTSELQSLT